MHRIALTGLAVVALVLGLTLVGCSNSDTGEGADVSAASVAPATPPVAGPETVTVAAATGGPLLEAIGNEVAEDGGYLCPVSGNVIANTPEELEKRPYVNYEGKSYYVWCPNCEAKFVGDPAGYIAGEVPTCTEMDECDAEDPAAGESAPVQACDAAAAPEGKDKPTEAPE